MVNKVFETKYDGYIIARYDSGNIKVFEGEDLCPATVKNFIKKNGVTELNCFRNEAISYGYCEKSFDRRHEWMSQEVKYFNKTEGVYQTPHYCNIKDLDALIKDWKSQVREDCLEHNADHYVYVTKEYDDDDNIVEVNLYAVPLADEEFDERVKATNQIATSKGTHIYFGVWHKGTSY